MMDRDSYIIVGFSTEKTDLFSSVIRWATRFRFSHVVLVSPDRQNIIEATTTYGVRDLPISEWQRTESLTELRRIPHPDPQGVWDRAMTQRGKPYDMKYSYGWFFNRRNWQDPNALACCELIIEAAKFFADGDYGPNNQRDLYLISYPDTPAPGGPC